MAAGNHDQENETNTLIEHHMETAIETVLSNQEQSYEDFMGCFVSLKKEDVAAHQAQMMQKMLQRSDKKATTEIQRSETEASKEDDQRTHVNIEEEIEIEELDDGYFAPARSSMDPVSGHKFVQVDNFVDDAELSEDDLQNTNSADEELEASPYESSFFLNEDSSKIPLKLSKDIVREVEEDAEGESPVMHLELQEGHDMRTLPGEAEDEKDGRLSSLSDDAIHETRLKMSTKMNQDVDNLEQSKVNLEISTDEVQPFSMDKDFDYDNVVLTPKWDSNHTPPGWKPSC
ncbi:protein C11orf74 homolog [Asterias rubens]|uniref:protein C11orf74 homolog n=1 Tax=Asterias rubens TaxID=7604 RepID=UPI001455B8F0|nr:protein C11orf74 homolog [Asterias rubens]